MSEKNNNETDLDLLRNLILGVEKDKIEVLEQHFDDPLKHIQDVSSVLPQAIKLSTSQNDQLSNELMPLVEKAVKVSVKRDINVFADALYPVIGPAIRKSISEALLQMIQSVNKALEHSFSWQGIKWRFEAWRSGKPFAEIVLLHSLVYRVEQVFLIHKKSGLLLHHTALAEVIQQDADLVSAMLSAIQDFVLDSFNNSLDDDRHSTNNQNSDSGHSLNQISMGEFSIWIEQGPDAVIAAVLKGTAPKTLRQEFIRTLENIHLQHALEMQSFNGDDADFSQVDEELQNCLLSQYHTEKKKTSWMTWILIGVVVLAIMAGFFVHIQERLLWKDYVQLIKAEPGIVITDINHEGGQYILRGLRDPLARKPQEILSASSLTQPLTLGPISINRLSSEQIVHYFEPYQSLTEHFVYQRALQQLQAPASVEIKIKKGVLKVSGHADRNWIVQLTKQSAYITGIEQLDISQLRPTIDLSKIIVPDTVKLSVDGDLLIATGHAPYHLVMSAKKELFKIPGINRYDDSQLQIDIDLSSLNAPDTVKLDYHDGLLSFNGTAPDHWLQNLQEKALAIPGVERVNLDKLFNTDLQFLNQLKQDLEKEAIFYNPGQSSSTHGNEHLLRIVSKAQLLLKYAEQLSLKPKIIIQGFSDSRGHYKARLNISYLRAEHVRQFFIKQGINESQLEAKSMVQKNIMLMNLTDYEMSRNRRVNFSVIFQENKLPEETRNKE